MWSRAAEAATEDPFGYRVTRADVRFVAAVPVRQFRGVVDEIARQICTLDLQIQQANWRVNLVNYQRKT